MPSIPDLSRREAVGLGTAFVFGSVVASNVRVGVLVDRLFPSARIGRLFLNNQDSASHRFRVVVDVAGERLYDETHAVAAHSARSVEDGLPPDRGRVSVTAAVRDVDADGAVASHTFTDDACFGVGCNYSRRHGLWLTSGAPVEECGTG